MSLAILVPVLNRPHRVRPLLESINATAPFPNLPLFITDTDDRAEKDAIWAHDPLLPVIDVDGNYAEKINAGVRNTHEGLLFLGADDLEFQPGWFEAAAAQMKDGVQVVGVNDLIERPNRPEHATHALMTREYAEATGPLHEGYHHWFCDDELICTATHRGVYAYAPDAHVKHLHPDAGLAEDDDTYRKGRSRWRQDRKLFAQRRHLWT